jgi:hypothetical protein
MLTRPTLRRLAATFALVLVVAAGRSAAATISVVAERDGDTIDIRASLVDADAATAWRVLTEYNR